MSLSPHGAGVLELPAESGPRILRAIPLLGDTATPRAIADLTGLSPRTVSKHLARLRAEGLVEGGTHSPRLTSRAQAELAMSVQAAPGSWDAVIRELWPPWHAALIRLILDAVCVRKIDPSRKGHPGFLAFGAIHTFKTSIADFVDAVLGFPIGESRIVVHLVSPGEIVGRRQQTQGGAVVFKPSRLTSRAFVCLDELGEMDRATRRQIEALLHGETVIHLEDQAISLAPVALACFNQEPGTGPLWPLREATWRRCLRLRTDDLQSSLPADLPRRLSKFYKGPRPVPLPLATMSLPCAHLDDDHRAWSVFEGDNGFWTSMLTDKGRTWHDRQSFESLILGRGARMGSGSGEDLTVVAYGVTLDMLTLADTIPGLVRNPGWGLDMATLGQHLSGALGFEDLAAAYEAIEETRHASREEAAHRRIAAEDESLEVTGYGARLIERFEDAAAQVRRPPKWVVAEVKEEAAELLGKLNRLRQSVGEARSRTSLDLLASQGQPLVERAHSVREDIASEEKRRSSQIDDLKKRIADLGRLPKTNQAIRGELISGIGAMSKLVGTAFDENCRHLDEQVRALVLAVGLDRQTAALAQSNRDIQSARQPALTERRKTLKRLSTRVQNRKAEDVASILETNGILRRHERVERVETPPDKVHRALDKLFRQPSGPLVSTRVVIFYEDADGRTYWPAQLAKWGTTDVLAVIDAQRRAEGL